MNLFRLKPALLPLLLLWQTAPQTSARFTHFRYQRAVTFAPSLRSAGAAPGGGDEACANLDAEVFAHAGPALKDLRLYSGSTELPFATTVSEPPQQDSDDARILNLHARPGQIVFDLEMPHRPYTGVVLDLAAHDYIATAIVSGVTSPSIENPGREAAPLGTFTLFDLSSQHLSRNTSISLSESTYPYLHVQLVLVPAPGSTASAASLNLPATVKSATVPPSREAQSLYTATQQEMALRETGPESVATFKVPARVPIERIAFKLPPGYKGSFSRNVRIEALGIAGDRADGQRRTGVASDDGSGFNSEDTTGTILRVSKSEGGHELSFEALSIPVAIGSNMQQPATATIHVDNGSEPALPLSVEIQMRQRRICFDAVPATSPLTLYYGDPSLEAPDTTTMPASEPGNGKLFLPVAAPRTAHLGPETLNLTVTAGPAPRKLAQHRPILRWIALLGAVFLFALLVIRSAKRAAHR